MNVFEIDDLPYAEFGNEPKRKVRLVISPYTTGKEDAAIVHVTVPPKGVSEGHIHEDCDEIIYFDIGGKAIIDGKEFTVGKNSIVFAPKGKMHECINTSTSDDLKLLCIFVPPFKPYGLYTDLIEKTNQYLDEKKQL